MYKEANCTWVNMINPSANPVNNLLFLSWFMLRWGFVLHVTGAWRYKWCRPTKQNTRLGYFHSWTSLTPSCSVLKVIWIHWNVLDTWFFFFFLSHTFCWSDQKVTTRSSFPNAHKIFVVGEVIPWDQVDLSLLSHSFMTSPPQTEHYLDEDSFSKWTREHVCS